MAIRQKMMCAALLLSVLGAWAANWQIGETLDVQTLDGHLYKQARLMSVNDGGINILCADPKGGDGVLRGISFDRLPQELRTRFGYDPAKFAAYQKSVGTYRSPEEKKPAPRTAPEEKKAEKKTEPPAAPKKEPDDVSNQTLAPLQIDTADYYSSWYYSGRRFWFGPNDWRPINPRPRPRPPHPGPRPRPGPRPHPGPCPRGGR